MRDMTFGCAIEEMKKGRICARRGWNGRDMWVGHTPGVKSLSASSFWHPPARAFAETNGGCADVLPILHNEDCGWENFVGVACISDRYGC